MPNPCDPLTSIPDLGAVNPALMIALNSVPLSIALVDVERRYIFGNQFFCEAYGIAPSDVIGMSSQLIFLSEEDWAAFGASAYPIIRSGQTCDREHVLRRQDDTPYPARIIGRLIDPGTPSLGTIWVVQDLTERKMAEAQSAAEQANIAKSRFLAAASHDLRQPFQAMMLYLSMLEAQLTAPADRKVLDGLAAAMKAGQELLDALLHISTLEAGVTQPSVAPTQLGTVLGSLVDEFTHEARNRGLALACVPSSAVIATDPVLLRRVLRNLVSNALKYTRRGRVLLGVRRMSGGGVRVEVWDTGIGIAASDLNEIWEEFSQLNNPERDRSKGLGLGLAIVARTCRLLGHSVSVQSWPGRGSAFAVRIDPSLLAPSSQNG